MICCICKKKIKPGLLGYDKGHNAEPVKRGRCCDSCNAIVVIPVRLRRLRDEIGPNN